MPLNDTVERVVVLAAFLPVLSCLAGNNGCQALAITLRGLTLGDLKRHPLRAVDIIGIGFMLLLATAFLL